jgi:multidrug resistance efflux pump
MNLSRDLPLPRARRWSLAASISLLALAVTCYGSSRSPSGPRDLVTGAAERDLKISETGELRALESVTIAAPDLKGVPLVYLVPEGALVRAGDELIQFDPSALAPLLAENKAALDASRADLKKARADRDARRAKLHAHLSRLESEVRLAQLDLERLKKGPSKEEVESARIEVERARLVLTTADQSRQALVELVAKGFLTTGVLQEAELRHSAAEARLQAAQAALERVGAGRPLPENLKPAHLRLAQAKTRADQAQAALRSQTLIAGAKERRDRMEIRAPKNGVVIYAKTLGEKAGDTLPAGMMPPSGEPLIYLLDLSSMVVATEISEVDIARVKVGAPAEVRLAAYPDTVFPAKVLQVGALARLKQSRTGGASAITAFEVIVQVEAMDTRLKPGLTATVDIIASRHVDVASVPHPAVIGQGPSALPANAATHRPTAPGGAGRHTSAHERPRYHQFESAQRWAATAVGTPAGVNPTLASLIEEAAARHRLPERLVLAVIKVESGFNPRAVSPKGARGLMQLMPGTAMILGVRDSFDPVANIEGGVRHLRGLMDRFGNNLPAALAAYNAGEGAVKEHGGIPPYPETREYVARILRLFGRPLDDVSSPAAYRRPIDDDATTSVNAPPVWPRLTTRGPRHGPPHPPALGSGPGNPGRSSFAGPPQPPSQPEG